MGGFRELADFAFPATDKYGSTPGRHTGDEVRNSIADHVAIRKRDVQFTCRLLEQSDTRLATSTVLLQFRHNGIRVMQAIIDAVNPPAGLCHLRKHFLSETFQGLLRQISFGDARLIRNNCNPESQFIKSTDCLRHAKQQLELRKSEG